MKKALIHKWTLLMSNDIFIHMPSFCDTHVKKDREMAKTSDSPGTFA